MHPPEDSPLPGQLKQKLSNVDPDGALQLLAVPSWESCRYLQIRIPTGGQITVLLCLTESHIIRQ